MLLDYQDKLSNNRPQRLVSLVPSLTETLLYCGLENNVLGRTRYCIHPAGKVDKIISTGGTKDPDLDKIKYIQPDLILATMEENRKEDIELLAKIFPVFVGDISDKESLIQYLKSLNELLHNECMATLVNQLTEFKIPCLAAPKSALYLIWQKPIMTIGNDTFIHFTLESTGFKSVSHQYQRYPQLSVDEIRLLYPEYILLSSEPYRFKEKHLDFYRVLFPESQVILVDGEMFSWYGSRLLQTPAYFENLFKKMRLPYLYPL